MLAEVARGDAADVDAAVQRRTARDAATGATSRRPSADGLLFRLADAIDCPQGRDRADRNAGRRQAARRNRAGDVDGVAATLRYNAGAADKIEGATIPLGRGVVDFTLLEPAGVTAHIVPLELSARHAGALRGAGPRSRLHARWSSRPSNRRSAPCCSLNAAAKPACRQAWSAS